MKVGYKKQKGSIHFEDEAQVIRLIKKHFPDRSDVLIRIRESLNKPALGELSVLELKRIGCTVEDTGDVPFVRAVEGEVEKVVEALLKEAAKAYEEEVA